MRPLEVRTLLRPLITKVHPDILADAPPLIRDSNAKHLAALHALVDTLEQGDFARLAARYGFRFYMRHKGRQASHGDGESQWRCSSASLVFPPALMQAQGRPGAAARRVHVERQLRGLLVAHGDKCGEVRNPDAFACAATAADTAAIEDDDKIRVENRGSGRSSGRLAMQQILHQEGTLDIIKDTFNFLFSGVSIFADGCLAVHNGGRKNDQWQEETASVLSTDEQQAVLRIAALFRSGRVLVAHDLTLRGPGSGGAAGGGEREKSLDGVSGASFNKNDDDAREYRFDERFTNTCGDVDFKGGIGAAVVDDAEELRRWVHEDPVDRRLQRSDRDEGAAGATFTLRRFGVACFRHHKALHLAHPAWENAVVLLHNDVAESASSSADEAAEEVDHCGHNDRLEHLHGRQRTDAHLGTGTGLETHCILAENCEHSGLLGSVPAPSVLLTGHGALAGSLKIDESQMLGPLRLNSWILRVPFDFDELNFVKQVAGRAEFLKSR
jgi:hypothetical protein